MAERLDFNLAGSPLVGDPVRARHSLRSGGAFRAPKKLFLGKCILGICQDHDVKGTSLVLPCTQGHTEFQITFRGCSGNAKNDYSRIRTATRRQTRQLLAKVVSSRRFLTSGFRVAFSTWDFVSGTFHRYSFQWPDAPGEKPTSSVGNRAPCN